MKKTILLFVCYSLLTTAFSQSYTLTVINGYSAGNGSYKAGSQVHIFSNSYPKTADIFTHWSSSTPNLFNQDSNEWHCIITMPAKNVTVTAHYQTIPNLNVNANFKGMSKLNLSGDSIIIEKKGNVLLYGLKNSIKDTTLIPDDLIANRSGIELLPREVYYFKPQNMKGLVYLFHWTGGTAQGWFDDPMRFEIVKDFINAGFAVAFTSCEERYRKNAGKQNWDINGDDQIRNVFDNRNIRNIKFPRIQLQDYVFSQCDLLMTKKLHQTLINNNVITDSTCIFSAGFSAGAAFAQTAAYHLRFKATACIGNSGAESLVAKPDYRIPTIFAYGEKDEDFNPNINDYLIKSNVLISCNALQARNVPYQNHPISPTPLHPKRFTQAENVTFGESQNIYNEFLIKNAVFTDTPNSQVFFKFHPSQIRKKLDSFPTWKAMENNSPDKFTAIDNIIYQIGAGHVATSSKNKKIVNFFKQQCTVPNTISSSLKPEITQTIQLFPNPAFHHIQVKSQIPIFNYQIYNLQGKLLQQINLQVAALQFTIPLPIQKETTLLIAFNNNKFSSKFSVHP